MATGLQILIAKRDALLKQINEHYYLILELSRWLSPPILETLTPAQVESYQDTLLFYMERIDVFIGQLMDALAELEFHGYTDLSQEILDDIDDILFVLNKIVKELPGEVDKDIEIPLVEVGGSMSNIQIDLDAMITVQLEADKGFWEKLLEDLGVFVTRPLDFLIEQGEQFTLDLMGMMFIGLIDIAGSKMSGFIDNAVGLSPEGSK